MEKKKDSSVRIESGGELAADTDETAGGSRGTSESSQKCPVTQESPGGISADRREKRSRLTIGRRRRRRRKDPPACEAETGSSLARDVVTGRGPTAGCAGTRGRGDPATARPWRPDRALSWEGSADRISDGLNLSTLLEVFRRLLTGSRAPPAGLIELGLGADRLPKGRGDDTDTAVFGHADQGLRQAVFPAAADRDLGQRIVEKPFVKDVRAADAEFRFLFRRAFLQAGKSAAFVGKRGGNHPFPRRLDEDGGCRCRRR